MEIRDLYDELLAFISGKRLRQDERERLQKIHTQREQEAYYRAMSKGFERFGAPEDNPSQKTLWGWVANLFVSGVSSVGIGYYDYQASKEEIRNALQKGEWQLTRELAKMGVPEGETVNEIRGLAETLRDYALPYDWGSNLFAGIVYFALGDRDEAINCYYLAHLNGYDIHGATDNIMASPQRRLSASEIQTLRRQAQEAKRLTENSAR